MRKPRELQCTWYDTSLHSYFMQSGVLVSSATSSSRAFAQILVFSSPINAQCGTYIGTVDVVRDVECYIKERWDNGIVYKRYIVHHHFMH